MLHHTIHRSDDPAASWVVLIHGAGVTSAIWDRQVEAFGDRHHLLLPDLRGHGGSGVPGEGTREGTGEGELEPPETREPHSWEEVAGDILVLMDHLGIGRAHLVAVSMGSIVARTLADMAPERVRSLVLAGAVDRLEKRARVLIALAHALKRFVPYLWLYRFYAGILLPRPSHRESRRTVVDQARGLGRAEFLRWLPITRGLHERLSRYAATDPGLPSLRVMGDQDHMFLPGARALAARHPTARLHVIEGCGHVCTVQCPEEFNRVALAFLEEV